MSGIKNRLWHTFYVSSLKDFTDANWCFKYTSRTLNTNPELTLQKGKKVSQKTNTEKQKEIEKYILSFY